MKEKRRAEFQSAFFISANVQLWKWLPDFAGLFADHGIALFAAKGSCECFHVRDGSVGAELG